MDRRFLQSGLSLETITPLTRLAYMGDKAMGALSYQSDFDNQTLPDHQALSLDALAKDALQVYQGSVTDVTEQLHLLGGSPGGARPKATIGLNNAANTAITGLRCYL